MRADHGIPPLVVRLVVRLGALALLGGLVGPVPARAADGELAEAERRHAEAVARLDGILQELDAFDARIGEVDARLAELRRQAAADLARAGQADATTLRRMRELYINVSSDPGLAVLASDSPQEAMEQARLLATLARGSREEQEGATAAYTRTEATLDAYAASIGDLEQRRQELETARAEAEALAQRELSALEDLRERLTREAAADGGAGPNAAVVGDVACPVGEPHSFSDTWGAPRSGGRSHKGTDILAARGIPIYAYESGTISRLSSGGLGGISLYLRGDSGTLYYYTHLSGYVDGISTGARVTAGQHLARNGDTGNARGIPHLHFEVKPGGGGNVNPYPYVRRACG